MSNQTLNLTEPVYRYLCATGLRESSALASLRQETAELPLSVMQISPEQGQFMALLIRLTDARRCLEVGTFTGYSALACAEALPEDGRLLALDISAEWTAVAQRHWQAAGLAEKIELKLGPAEDSLGELLAGGQAGSFDFMFIDADKTGYSRYYELGLQLLRTGGLMLVDNVLWDGAVVDESKQDEDTQAIRSFNQALSQDQRIDLVMLPLSDGLSLARKRQD